MRWRGALESFRPSKARAATLVLLGLTTVAGCACDAPMPVVHVSPGTTVQVGQVVTFDSNQGPNDPADGIEENTNVSWDLDGNGTFGDLPGQRVVQRTFDTPGTYKVSFDAVNLIFDSWLDSSPYFLHGYDTRTITVTAPPGPQPPTASFSFSPSPGYTERDIGFDASGSKDADGRVVKYEWDWEGDGTYDETDTSPTTTHNYPFAGTYTVRLRVTDNDGQTGTTEQTVQVMDGVPPGGLIAREAAGVTAAGAGSPFTIGLGQVAFTPGTTTVSGVRLVTAGMRAHGRLHFKKAPKLLGRNRSPRWAGSLALVQRGSGAGARLSGQGYILLALSKTNSVCLAGTASATLLGRGFKGKLAVAGGTGTGARLRGTGIFSPAVHVATKPALSGRLKLRQVRKKRGLPMACRTLARTLGG
jgi:PKD repeat protein